MKIATIAAVAAAAGFASSAMASAPYPNLRFDIQQFSYEADSALSESYTGSINYTLGAGFLNSVEGSDSGAFGTFESAGDGGTLTDFTGMLTFVSGNVTGGSFSWTNDTGDTITVDVVANAGSLNSTAGSGFAIDGLLIDFVFSDDMFGAVDASEFFDMGTPLPATGDFLNLRLAGGMSGTADGEFQISAQIIPAPTAAGLGLAGLAGIATRRRR
ncbi:MAG: hypothetical protein AAGB51_00745 [Planctomycetota bacterium]